LRSECQVEEVKSFMPSKKPGHSLAWLFLDARSLPVV